MLASIVRRAGLGCDRRATVAIYVAVLAPVLAGAMALGVEVTSLSGTQLDVLDAQTSLTQARTTQIQAQHDYVAARARVERAIGADLAPVK